MTETKSDRSGKQSWQPNSELFVPAKTTYVSRRGDAVYTVGAPKDLHRDSDGAWFDPPAFSIPAQRTPFGPLIRNGYANVRDFDFTEWECLSVILGTELPQNAKDVIQAAVSLLVNTVLLKDQTATWAQLKAQTSKLKKLTTALLANLQTMIPEPPKSAAIPASQTVGAFIAMQLGDAPYGLTYLIAELKTLNAFCDEAGLLASNGPGTEDQAEFRIFLRTVRNALAELGVEIKLLSSQAFASWNPTDEVEPPKLPVSPFLQFMTELLRLTDRVGEEGIVSSVASEVTKKAAVEDLRAYTREKSLKALSKQFGRLE